MAIVVSSLTLLWRSLVSLRLALPFHLLEHGDRLRKVRLKVSPHDVQHFDQHAVAQRVENLVSFFSVHNDLPASQYGQVLRKIRLLDPDFLLNRARRQFSVSENLDD